MRIAIIGTGGVGTALGSRLLKRGHEVRYGSRYPGARQDFIKTKQLAGASVGTTPEVTRWAEAVILAVPGSVDEAGIKATASSLGPGIKGKVLLDATNPLTAAPALEAALGHDVAVYKAFNTIGTEHMHQPEGSLIGEPGVSRLRLMYAGQEGPNAQVAGSIIEEVGFEPVFVGPIRYARNLEALAELYIHLGVPGVGATHQKTSPGRNFHFQYIGRLPHPERGSAAL